MVYVYGHGQLALAMCLLWWNLGSQNRQNPEPGPEPERCPPASRPATSSESPVHQNLSIRIFNPSPSCGDGAMRYELLWAMNIKPFNHG
jgi:hypothetical protein